MFSSFMVNTWIVGSIVAVMAGVVGFFVVVRGASFAAHSLPLGAFPGAAAASLLGVNPLAGLALFSGIGVVIISQLRQRERHEVATALALVMLLGLGALFLSMTREYFQAVYALLFGEVLGIAANEVAPIAVMSLAAILAILLLYRPLLLSSLSLDLAEARGISVTRMELYFMAIVALATAMALPVVGALLVFSLMVGPASAARAITSRPMLAMFLSAVIALLTVWSAIAMSYLSNWPVGFFVGAFGVVAYLAGRIGRRVSWRPAQTVRA